MSSPVAVGSGNQYDALASPIEGKTREEGRSRGGKDDVKEQAYQAREQVKSKAADLKEQVINKVQAGVSQGIDYAKQKAGISKDKPTEEIVAEVQEKGNQQWETVKRKGAKQMNAAKQAVDDKLDENLTPDQKNKLNKAAKQAKNGAYKLEKQAEGWSNQLVGSVLAGPRLRPVKNFIQKNNLALPAVIFGAFMSLYFGLSIIRLITTFTSPKVPEFDIHSKTESLNWLKFHAGEYKDKAVDMRESLSGRAAAFLANHEWEKLKASAVDYRDLGMNKLGLTEPTWGEWAWAKVTGRPITWQDRVENVLDLAKEGINKVDLKSGGVFDRIKNLLTPHEATMAEKAYATIKNRMPGLQREPEGIVDGLKNKLADGYEQLASRVPGTESYEAAKQRVYEATHPSTVQQLKNGAEYIKNRVVHGAQEAAHIAQDRANEAVDKAKYKTGI